MTTVASSLTGRLAAWPSTPPARRAVRSWAGHPRLGCFSNAGEAAVAARSDGVLLAVLAGRRDEESSAMAAVSAVAWHLLPVVARWSRAGVPAGVFEDLDADLVAEALAIMADRPGLPADRLAQLAWQRVSGGRRTERARGRRQVSLDERSFPAVPGPAGRVCLTGSHGLVALAAL